MSNLYIKLQTISHYTEKHCTFRRSPGKKISLYRPHPAIASKFDDLVKSHIYPHPGLLPSRERDFWACYETIKFKVTFPVNPWYGFCILVVVKYVMFGSENTNDIQVRTVRNNLDQRGGINLL